MGKAAAGKLLAEGYAVYAVARRTDRMQELAELGAVVASYARRSGSAVRAVTFSRADAERPLLTASDQMWEYFEAALRQRLVE
jgi:NAD(P)-dependent dehydrogenase (short-subunit alcohol dehydrogenase family)